MSAGTDDRPAQSTGSQEARESSATLAGALGSRLPELGRTSALPGVGPARERKLRRLGIASIRDVLLFVPRRLETWPQRLSIAAARAAPQTDVTVAGKVTKVGFQRFRGQRSLVRVRVEDETAGIDALFFNQAWMRNHFQIGDEVELHGRVVDAKGPALSSPRVGSPSNPLPAAGSLIPVYPTTEGLAQGLLAGLCRAAVQSYAERLVDPLPEALLEQLGMPALPEAVRQIHAPLDLEAFRAARRRLEFEPLLRHQARCSLLRRDRAGRRARTVAVDDANHRELLECLPFELTAGQSGAVRDLRDDLASGLPMRRLLQGDVGSGKTLVGVYACLAAARAGSQSAFLAPTEILAEQHFDGLRAILARAGLRSVLLTGSLPAGERRQVLSQLASGMVDVAFGTHALFSSDVVYRDLALAVIDEQHRFGVEQRARLIERGAREGEVHALLMTATPIPRTLALTLYGDLDLSLIRDRPPGRGSVRTRWIRGHDRRRVPAFMSERLEAGEQIFWVSPRIGEEADEGAHEAAGAPASAIKAYERLRASKLARHGIELVHGRLPAAERSARLERFRRGEARVLVATTVIEVGVDVPQATVMVIENAERLGLVQLHQLRGRIGRGPGDSWCLLFGRSSAEDRFLLLEQTDDGFELAEEDLRRRGMGDLAGVRQAGENAEGLDQAQEKADLFLMARDLVNEHPVLAEIYAEPQEVKRLTP